MRFLLAVVLVLLVLLLFVLPPMAMGMEPCPACPPIDMGAGWGVCMAALLGLVILTVPGRRSAFRPASHRLSALVSMPPAQRPPRSS